MPRAKAAAPQPATPQPAIPTDKLQTLKKAARERTEEIEALKRRHTAAVDRLVEDPDSESAESDVSALDQQLVEAGRRLAALDSAIERIEAIESTARCERQKKAGVKFRVEAVRIHSEILPALAAKFDQHIAAASEALLEFKKAANQCGSNTREAVCFMFDDTLRQYDALALLGPRADGTSDQVVVSLASTVRRLLRIIDAPTTDNHIAINAFLPPNPSTLAEAVALDNVMLKGRLK